MNTITLTSFVAGGVNTKLLGEEIFQETADSLTVNIVANQRGGFSCFAHTINGAEFTAEQVSEIEVIASNHDPSGLSESETIQDGRQSARDSLEGLDRAAFLDLAPESPSALDEAIADGFVAMGVIAP